MERHRFALYIAGETERSAKAIQVLENLCEEDLGGDYEFVVIDVIRRPEQAVIAGIQSTPTVIREAPPPSVHFSTDWDDPVRLRAALLVQPPSDDA